MLTVFICGHFLVGFIMAITLYKADQFPFDSYIDTDGAIGVCIILVTLIGYISFIILLSTILIFRPLGFLIQKYL